jgi:hypothetical protein
MAGPQRPPTDETCDGDATRPTGEPDPAPAGNVPDPETAEVPDATYIVIAGRHRLEAYRKLGLQHIPAIVRNCGELEAKLGETAERAAEPPEAV